MILVDGDLLAYKAAVASERESDFGDDMWGFAMDMREARQRFDADLNDAIRPILSEMDCVMIAFSDSRNWRKEEYPEYKSNRSGKRKPCGYVALRDWICEYYTTITAPYLEADDIMGILSTSSENSIIVSTDKDMETIPGYLFNWDKDEFPRQITKQEADFNHMKQTLVGDAVDGFPGCPGVGPVKAKKILSDHKDSPADMWEAVLVAYEKKELDEEYALSQARMARICRSDDWDAQKRKMVWTPERN